MIGNARHMPRHRAVVTAIRDGHDTIPKIVEATGIEDKCVRTSIAYVRNLSIVETLPEKVRHKAQYRLAVPYAVAIASLPIEMPAPTFSELENALGMPREIASTLVLQARPRLVKGMDMGAEV